MPSPKNISSSQPFVNPLNVALSNGMLTFDLSQAANIIGNGSVVPRRVAVSLDATGKCPTTAIWFNDELNPSGTAYLMQVFDSSGNFAGSFGQIVLSGASVDLSTLVPTSTSGGIISFNDPVLKNPGADQAIISGNLSLAPSLTLLLNNIKQQAGVAFLLNDPNGVSHFFISNSAPYTNTFIQGNGTGGVFLGSASKAVVADTTGTIFTAGSIILQTTAGVLPATFVNDTLGGFLFTTNAGKGWQIANSTGQLQGFAGVNILLQGSSSGGITLAVPAAAGSNTLTFPAATDTLVGKATTDTITNKTLTGASSGNNVTLVNWQGSAAPITGTGADVTLYTFSIPGNTMGAGKGIFITAGWQHSTGTASVTTKFKYGATTVATNSEAGTGLTIVTWYVMNNPGVTNAQTAWQEIGQDAGSSVVYSPQIATPAENSTGAVSATVTFSVANTDAVTPKFFKIELVQ